MYNKVERWANEGFGMSQMAKWGKHFADDKYVILKFVFEKLKKYFKLIFKPSDS